MTCEQTEKYCRCLFRIQLSEKVEPLRSLLLNLITIWETQKILHIGDKVESQNMNRFSLGRKEYMAVVWHIKLIQSKDK